MLNVHSFVTENSVKWLFWKISFEYYIIQVIQAESEL